MRRREFITLLGGAATTWPLAAQAQQGERMRRIGVLIPGPADDRVYQARFSAFLQGLRQLGWTDGRNVRIDTRWAAGDADLIRRYAEELVALGPDVVMAFNSVAVQALRRVTQAIPIVFAVVADPVGAGYVESLARPGGNVTGLSTFEYALGGKWLELLKEIAPRTARVAVLRDSSVAIGPAMFAAIQTVAPSLGVELRPIDERNTGEIERAITEFAAASSNGGLIVTGSPAATLNRDLIVALAARYKLPAVFYERYFVVAGGLIATLIGYLINPSTPAASVYTSEASAAANALGISIRIFNASTEQELDELFASLPKSGISGLAVPAEPFFDSQRDRIVALAARYSVPAIYGLREYAIAGGLMSYGTSLPDTYRRAAIYVGRVLKGEKPANLPVVQPTKYDLVLNIKTAKALGLSIPDQLIVLADEVIE